MGRGEKFIHDLSRKACTLQAKVLTQFKMTFEEIMWGRELESDM
jgi:hypothetical protein